MSIYWYILVMALTTNLIRVLPLTIYRKPIKNRFIRSFLAYVPPACLAAMTFPAILYSGTSVISGALGLAVALFLAIRKKSLLVVAGAACAAVFIAEQIVILITG